jgi:3',5'-cyclic-AMP phosphodiesterase
MLSYRGLRCWTAIILLVAGLAGWCQAGTVSGRVACDLDGDRRAEAGEPGVAGVRVSDGTTIAVTDAAGVYALPDATSYRVVNLTLPTGYAASGEWWHGVVPTAAPQVFDFALQPQSQSPVFYFAQGTDVHTTTLTVGKVQKFAAEVSAQVPPAAFLVVTGDLVMDVLPAKDDVSVRALYGAYINGMKSATIPVRSLPGNHENVGYGNAAYPRENPFFGKGAYRHLLGPTHYSWEYGGWLFLALDGTMPRDPAGSGYVETITPECMTWLKAELGHVSATQPIVMFVHEPTPGLANRAELAGMFQGHNLRAAFSGHWHNVEPRTFAGVPEVVGGAVCGSWWSGPCPDGSPQGYRVIRCAGDQVQSFYQATGVERHVDILTPAADTVVTGETEVVASIWDPKDEMTEGRVLLGGKATKVEFIYRGAWKEIRAFLDPAGLPAGKCELQVGAVDRNGHEWMEKRDVKIGG